MNRRAFLETAAGMACMEATAQAASIPIIDTHIHLFDPTRPEGVPWPDKTNAVLYRPALPDRYRKIAVPLGVVGAIEVEASPLLEDNQWVLDIAAKDKIVVGTVGDLEPGKADFRKQLARFHANPLFLGIRYGNLWGRNLSARVAEPGFISDLKALAEAGLSLDTANQNAELLAAVVRVTDGVPKLRVIIDHLPQFQPPTEAGALKNYRTMLREIGKRPQVYVKISEVLRRVDGRVPEDMSFYRARLDELFDIFGQDRVLFGSDWPNSDTWAPYPKVLNVVREYFTGKGQAIAEKYFWKNSVAAYRWVKREVNQPGLA
ncbi:MAG: amidohydrolase family protein [Acidobacteriota bacterium]|nr:amidohydrolase family protein [Acidobacteriota bacterium]